MIRCARRSTPKNTHQLVQIAARMQERARSAEEDCGLQQSQKQLGQLKEANQEEDFVQEPGTKWLKTKKTLTKTRIDNNQQDHRTPWIRRDKRPKRVSPTHAQAKAPTEGSATALMEESAKAEKATTQEEETPQKYSSVLYLKNAMRKYC